MTISELREKLLTVTNQETLIHNIYCFSDGLITIENATEMIYIEGTQIKTYPKPYVKSLRDMSVQLP